MTNTSLNARETVSKTHSRIEFRGKLDSLNARIILIQSYSENREYISDLEQVRQVVTKLQKYEVQEKEFDGKLILWGMNEDEIHGRSHNTQEFYGLGHILPCHEMGREAAEINFLRTLVREAELSACYAFNDNDTYKFIHVLNRLSSALYILTYKYLPKGYDREIRFTRLS